MTEEKRQFTVISNDTLKDFERKKNKDKSYLTNPMKYESDSLREQMARFRNGEAGRRFTVEDLLRGC